MWRSGKHFLQYAHRLKVSKRNGSPRDATEISQECCTSGLLIIRPHTVFTFRLGILFAHIKWSLLAVRFTLSVAIFISPVLTCILREIQAECDRKLSTLACSRYLLRTG